LTIYNITGQKIRTLLTETMYPGQHYARWDGKNEQGYSVSSGTYIVNLKAGNSVSTHLMMLVR
jgi:flagellar hook assembly protein FlgD